MPVIIINIFTTTPNDWEQNMAVVYVPAKL